MKDYTEKGQALYWEPVSPVHFINYCYDDKVIEALEALFGSFPVIVSKDHLPTLRAMQRIGGGRPLENLIKAVEQEGEIRLWWDRNDWRTVKQERRNAIISDVRGRATPTPNGPPSLTDAEHEEVKQGILRETYRVLYGYLF